MSQATASAAVMVLDALVANADALSNLHYLLLPDLTPLSREDLVGELLHAPKPISCVSLLVLQSIAIGYWHRVASDPSWTAFHRSAARDAAGTARGMCMEEGLDPTALVVGKGVEVALSIDELEQFLLDYDFPLADYRVERPPQPRNPGSACAPRIVFERSPGTIGLSGSATSA